MKNKIFYLFLILFYCKNLFTMDLKSEIYELIAQANNYANKKDAFNTLATYLIIDEKIRTNIKKLPKDYIGILKAIDFEIIKAYFEMKDYNQALKFIRDIINLLEYNDQKTDIGLLIILYYSSYFTDLSSQKSEVDLINILKLFEKANFNKLLEDKSIFYQRIKYSCKFILASYWCNISQENNNPKNNLVKSFEYLEDITNLIQNKNEAVAEINCEKVTLYYSLALQNLISLSINQFEKAIKDKNLNQIKKIFNETNNYIEKLHNLTVNNILNTHKRLKCIETLLSTPNIEFETINKLIMDMHLSEGKNEKLKKELINLNYTKADLFIKKELVFSPNESAKIYNQTNGILKNLFHDNSINFDLQNKSYLNKLIDFFEIQTAKEILNNNIIDAYPTCHAKLETIAQTSDELNKSLANFLLSNFYIEKISDQRNIILGLNCLNKINLDILQDPATYKKEILQLKINGYFYLGVFYFNELILCNNIENIKQIQSCIDNILAITDKKIDHKAYHLKIRLLLYSKTKENYFEALNLLEQLKQAGEFEPTFLNLDLRFAYYKCAEYIIQDNNTDLAYQYFVKSFEFGDLNALYQMIILKKDSNNINEINFFLEKIEILKKELAEFKSNQNKNFRILSKNNETLDVMIFEKEKIYTFDELENLKNNFLLKKAIIYSEDKTNKNNLLSSLEFLESIKSRGKEVLEYLEKIYINLGCLIESENQTPKASLNYYFKALKINPQNDLIIKQIKNIISNNLQLFDKPKEIINILEQFNYNNCLEIKYYILDNIVCKLFKTTKKADILLKSINDLMSLIEKSNNQKYKALIIYQKARILKNKGENNKAYNLLKNFIEIINNQEAEKLFKDLKETQIVIESNKEESIDINNQIDNLSSFFKNLAVKNKNKNYIKREDKIFILGNKLAHNQILRYLQNLNNININSQSILSKNDILKLDYWHKKLIQGQTDIAVEIGYFIWTFNNIIPDIVAPKLNEYELPEDAYILKVSNNFRYQDYKNSFKDIDEKIESWQNKCKELAKIEKEKRINSILSFFYNQEIISQEDFKNLISDEEDLDILIDGIAYGYFECAYEKNKNKHAELYMNKILYVEEDVQMEDYNINYKKSKEDLKIEEEINNWFKKYYGSSLNH